MVRTQYFLRKLTGGLPSYSSWVRIFTGYHGEETRHRKPKSKEKQGKN
jgi:hypothetical protein